MRPAGFREMRRIEGRSSPAHQAAKRFLRGANLANSLEAPPGQDWGGHYTPQDLRLIKNEGFDHVRIPVAWHHYTGPAPDSGSSPRSSPGSMSSSMPACARSSASLINIHHFDDFTTNPKAQTAKFEAIWAQLAAHYARSPDGLAFELLNEPKDAATTEVLNPDLREDDQDRFARPTLRERSSSGLAAGTASASCRTCGCLTTTKT